MWLSRIKKITLYLHGCTVPFKYSKNLSYSAFIYKNTTAHDSKCKFEHKSDRQQQSLRYCRVGMHL
jgi:hypothetical protein